MKFKIGDRVAYRAVDSGNTDLDGWVGTVVYVDGTSAPYTVRFDNFYRGGIIDGRCPVRGGVRPVANGGYDWFCREENLTPLGVRKRVRRTRGGRATSPSTETKQEREGPSHTKQEEKDMARGIKGHEWTAAEDAVIREMLEGGSSVIDVCDRLGVDMVAMKNHLHALRKADPTFPRCMKRQGGSDVAADGGSEVPCERDVAADGGSDVAAEGGSGDVPTGALGELEQALADALADVTAQRDELQRELKAARDALQCAAHSAPARDRVAELTEENARLAEAQVRLQIRLDEAHKSLAEREDEVRELALQLEAVRRERDALIEEKECYTEEFEDGVAYYKQQAAEAEKIVSAKVDEMEKVRAENRRLAAEVCEVNRIVVGLCGRYVLPGKEAIV